MKREIQLLLNRPFDLAMITWVPLLLGLLICWIFLQGIPTRLPVGVLDADHSAASRQLQRFLDAAPGLQIAAQFEDEAELERAMRAGRVYAAVVIPAGFARTVKFGHAAQLVLLHNAQFATHSGLIQKDVRTVVGTMSAGIEIIARTKRGQPLLAAHQTFEPMRTALVSQFNTALDYEQFLVTALIPSLLHVLAMVAGAWGVGRELRDGTIGEWLADGKSAACALLAKLSLPWLAFTLLNIPIWLWLAAPHRWVGMAQLPVLLLVHSLMFAVYISLGALAVLISSSLRMGLSAAGFITAPAFAFSGIGFPLLAMPVAASWWAKALPLTWVLQEQVSVLQLGNGLQWHLPLALLLATILMFLACVPLLTRTARQPQRWGQR